MDLIISCKLIKTCIIKNAIEHSKNNSKIHIKIEDSSVFTKIIIEDEGEGTTFYIKYMKK